MTSMGDPAAAHIQQLRRVAHWIVLLGGSIVGASFIVFTTYNVWSDPAIRSVVQQHFAAVVGLPAAAIASLCVVLFLEGAAGPIEFEGLGFRFKGAAGPLVFWVMCFLSMTLAIKVCW